MNILDYRHPRVTFLTYVSLLVWTMIKPHPVLTVWSVVGSLLLLFSYYRAGAKDTVKRVTVLFLLIALFNPLFVHRGVTVVGFLFGRPITVEAMLYGVQTGLMIAAIMLWSASFSRLLNSEKVLALTGGVMPKISLILMLTLRSIPRYKRKLKQMEEVYVPRPDHGKIRRRLALWNQLFGWAIEESVVTADSMLARGYGIGPRSSFNLFIWRKADTAALLWLIVWNAAMGVATHVGLFDITFYPRFAIMGFRPLSVILPAFMFLAPALYLMLDRRIYRTEASHG